MSAFQNTLFWRLLDQNDAQKQQRAAGQMAAADSMVRQSQAASAMEDAALARQERDAREMAAQREALGVQAPTFQNPRLQTAGALGAGTAQIDARQRAAAAEAARQEAEQRMARLRYKEMQDTDREALGWATKEDMNRLGWETRERMNAASQEGMNLRTNIRQQPRPMNPFQEMSKRSEDMAGNAALYDEPEVFSSSDVMQRWASQYAGIWAAMVEAGGDPATETARGQLIIEEAMKAYKANPQDPRLNNIMNFGRNRLPARLFDMPMDPTVAPEEDEGEGDPEDMGVIPAPPGVDPRMWDVVLRQAGNDPTRAEVLYNRYYKKRGATPE